MNRNKKDLLSGVTKEVTNSKKVANNTLMIDYQDGERAIRLHDTDIITFKNDNCIVLDSGGWRTVTTKERINTFTKARLSQVKGIWYLDGSTFYDGIVIDSNGKVISGSKSIDLKKVDKVKKQISKFTNLITKDNLPVPSNGDCWYCLMTTNESKTLGDATGNHDHLEAHIKEGYLHGSLLVNAMREKGYQDYQIGAHYSMKLVDTFKRALRQYLQKRLIKNIAVK